ncbi:type II secretion system protein E [Sulfolobales archaeon HS-7]|nr:type II secretion system protein E [Sulfolobales archaeon HS-7]
MVPIKFPKKNNKVTIDTNKELSEMPLTLIPFYTISPEELNQIVADYEVDITKTIPSDVITELQNNRIDTEIALPHVFIAYDDNKGLYTYNVVEPEIDSTAMSIYIDIIGTLERKLIEEGSKLSISSIIKDVASLHKTLINTEDQTRLTLSTPGKIALYYFFRNVFGYNILTTLLTDPRIEDISIGGIGQPVYVYHREYEYIPTNITINDIMKVNNVIKDGKELLDQILLRFVFLANKTISIANPIADGVLPTGSRIAATFRNEISVRGSSMVIRKFAGRPITVLDLINSNVMSPEAAAFLWYAIDMKMTFMVMGVTGAGKTTVLNAILNLVKDTNKIVSIEDIPELRLANENWIQLVSRPAYGDTGKEISLMDLVKLSLRYRPDIIIVGEIRGQEAYVLFQAISTGHGGATTFHAYDIDSATKRLINNPLNIPEAWIPMMNLGIVVRRLPVFIGDKMVLRRRIVSIDEIVEYNDFRRVVSWDPRRDAHVLDIENSKVMRNRLEESGKTLEEAKEEIERRTAYLKALTKIPQIVQSDESYKELKKYIVKYSIRPEEAIKEVTMQVRT